MRSRVTIFAVMLLAVLGLMLSSCNLGVSVDQRLDAFLADLNSADRSQIYLNFHPTLTQDYDEIRNDDFPDWGILFPLDERPYSYFNLSTADTDNVTGRIEGTGTGYDAVFVLVMDGMDWQIDNLSLDGGTTNIQ